MSSTAQGWAFVAFIIVCLLVAAADKHSCADDDYSCRWENATRD